MRSVSKIAQPRPAPALPPVSVIDRPQADAELEALEGHGLDELRLQWRNRWGRLAPAHLSRGLLFRLMAYRIQVEAFGDLDRHAARLLDRLAAEKTEDRASGAAAAADASNPFSPSLSKTLGSESPLVLKPGALLTREWQSRIERVMALEEGFAWNGKTYASLSAVAFAITGVKWNGHRFFFGPNGRGGGGRGGGKAGRIGLIAESDPSLAAEAAP
jgi:hypothetical protein